MSGATTFIYNGAVIQYDTIETAGTYQITAYGAQGGSIVGASVDTGGEGAEVIGNVLLRAGTVLEIVVGGEGAEGNAFEGGISVGDAFGGGGGGGGSFVIETYDGTSNVDTTLLVAGGGGGGSQLSGVAAPNSTSGGDNGGALGGTGGLGCAGGKPADAMMRCIHEIFSCTS